MKRKCLLHTHILAFILYFFLFASINSQTISSRLIDMTLKQVASDRIKSSAIEDDDDDDEDVEDNDADKLLDVSGVVFFKNSFSSSLTSSLKLLVSLTEDIF
jgi:hypothetical protein